MFKRLRNRFLILNMTITSIVMISAFVFIYFTTYNNVRLTNENKLNSMSGTKMTVSSQINAEDKEKGESRMINQYISSDYSLSFSVIVDAKGEILQIDSIIDMPEEAYEQAARTAWNNQDNDKLTIEGKEWQYAINQMSITNVVEDIGQVFTISDDSYQIAFIDITESKKSLFELLTTLLMVGFVMVIIIFFLSYYFASRVIKPISEAWEKQKRFIADASHELKTPLSIITANYDVLMSSQEETIKSQMKWFGYLKIGTDRMAKLINDLLSLAKIESIDFSVKKCQYNISSTVHDVISLMEASAAEKGIKLSLQIESDIYLKGDNEKVSQIVSILMDNAIKYTNENGEIDLFLSKSKRQVQFTIKNSGKGITKQELPKIFDRFYRGDPSRSQESGGFGLGLSIAKSIIDSMGGQISATSIENESTTFTFTLELI